MMKSATGSEWVFVYGTLREGGSNAVRMKDGNILTTGRVQGRLYRISWYPGLVLGGGRSHVRGEVYEVSPAHLRALDEYEGIAAGETEGREYRRVRVQVTLDPPIGESLEAWAWEWRGRIKRSRRIHSGDWIDFVKPRAAPLFTLLGMIPLGCPVAVFLGMPNLSGLVAYFLVICLLLAPVTGIVLIVLADRRREECQLLRAVQMAVYLIWLALEVTVALPSILS